MKGLLVSWLRDHAVFAPLAMDRHRPLPDHDIFVLEMRGLGAVQPATEHGGKEAAAIGGEFGDDGLGFVEGRHLGQRGASHLGGIILYFGRDVNHFLVRHPFEEPAEGCEFLLDRGGLDPLPCPMAFVGVDEFGLDAGKIVAPEVPAHMSEGALLPFVAGGEMVDLVVVEVVVYDLIDPGVGRGSTGAQAFADLCFEFLGVGLASFEGVTLALSAVADIEIPPTGAFCGMWANGHCYLFSSRGLRRLAVQVMGSKMGSDEVVNQDPRGENSAEDQPADESLLSGVDGLLNERDGCRRWANGALAVLALDGLGVDHFGTVWALAQSGSAARAGFGPLSAGRATPDASFDGQQDPDDQPQSTGNEGKEKVEDMVGAGTG